MFRMILVAYMAIPVLAAATYNGSVGDVSSSLSCPCGQCEEGCACCAGGECTCVDCVCESCGCNGSTSFIAEGETPSCCSAGVCPATLVSSQNECTCVACPASCDGCEDCTDGECVCADCAEDQ